MNFRNLAGVGFRDFKNRKKRRMPLSVYAERERERERERYYLWIAKHFVLFKLIPLMLKELLLDKIISWVFNDDIFAVEEPRRRRKGRDLSPSIPIDGILHASLFLKLLNKKIPH